MRRAKVDRNHGEIRDALRAMGWYVYDTARVGGGFPDLVCAKNGRLVLAEVKDGNLSPSRTQLTKAEDEVIADFYRHGVFVRVLCTMDDVARMNGIT